MGWPWAAGSIPAWAALPYGQAVLKASFPALDVIASAAGYLYGSDATHLNLPDERGRVEVGKDDMGGVAANRITAAISGVAGSLLGAVFGTEGITLTTAQLPAHNHGVTGSPGLSDPSHRHSQLNPDGNLLGGNSGGGTGATLIDDSQYQTGNTHTTFEFTGISVNVGSLGTGLTGSGSAHQNTQPSIIVNRIMRVV